MALYVESRPWSLADNHAKCDRNCLIWLYVEASGTVVIAVLAGLKNVESICSLDCGVYNA